MSCGVSLMNARNLAMTLACAPDYADAHWNEGLTRLLLGDFERVLEEIRMALADLRAVSTRGAILRSRFGSAPSRSRARPFLFT